MAQAEPMRAGSGRASDPAGVGRRLAANTLHAASGRILGVLLWLVFTPRILQSLGVEGFAIWSLFLALTGYLSALDLGLVQSTLRHVAAARARGSHEEAGAFATLGVVGFLALGVLWLALLAGLHDFALRVLRVPASQAAAARFALVAGGAAFALAGISNVFMAVAQAYGRFDLANSVAVTISLFQGAGLLVVLSHGWGLRGLVASLCLALSLGIGLAAAVLAKKVPEFHWSSPRRSMPRLREALSFGGTMQLAGIFSAFHLQLDKLLLAGFIALAAVTPYELGARVAISASTFPQLLLLAVLPAAAAFHTEDDRARLRELYRRGGRYVLGAGAIALAILLGTADRLFVAWLGAGHEVSAGVLRALAIGFAVALATGMGTSLVRGVGRPDIEAWFAGVVAATHLALSLWLVPALGLRGALLAWVVSNTAGAAFFLWRLSGLLHWHRREVLVEPHVVPALAATLGWAAAAMADKALPAAAGLSAWLAAMLLGALAATVVIAVLLGSRYLDLREVRSLWPSLRKANAA